MAQNLSMKPDLNDFVKYGQKTDLKKCKLSPKKIIFVLILAKEQLLCDQLISKVGQCDQLGQSEQLGKSYQFFS